MTTTVTVKVNGRYRATVVQDDRPPVVVNEGEEKYFSLPHPADAHFHITEEPAIPAENQTQVTE